jgi:hypothetical protein
MGSISGSRLFKMDKNPRQFAISLQAPDLNNLSIPQISSPGYHFFLRFYEIIQLNQARQNLTQMKKQ